MSTAWSPTDSRNYITSAPRVQSAVDSKKGFGADWLYSVFEAGSGGKERLATRLSEEGMKAVKAVENTWEYPHTKKENLVHASPKSFGKEALTSPS